MYSCDVEIKSLLGVTDFQGANYVLIASPLSAFNKMPHKLVKGYGVPHQNDTLITARASSLVYKRNLNRERARRWTQRNSYIVYSFKITDYNILIDSL